MDWCSRELPKLWSSIVDTADYIFKSDSYALGQNLTADGYARSEGQHAHHIVAATDIRAEPARGVLAAVGISVNSAFNGVFLNGPYHSGLHTNANYANVNLSLQGATSAADVAVRLTIMRGLMQSGTFPH